MRRFWVLLWLLPTLLLGQDDPWADEAWEEEPEGWVWTGFTEVGVGSRVESDPLISQPGTLREVRIRTETEWQPGRYSLSLKVDGGYDDVENQAFLDVRDLSVSFSLAKLDIKAGRQVQTWGTGDLLFLNDLFPKDFQSFFSGREDEYLKAPADSVRVSFFSSSWNADVVWNPWFTSDRYLTGERFSFFSPSVGGGIAPNPPLEAKEPPRTPGNGEIAARLFRTAQGREYAVYLSRGFFKQPSAVDATGQFTYSPMTSVGASLRQSAGPGLLSLELSYYDSSDDRDESEPTIPHDQARVLIGFEWEARSNLTMGLQAYGEWTLDRSDLIEHSLAPRFETEELRALVTHRLTYRTRLGRSTLSLFTFYSPTDEDLYLRPSWTYRYDDRWSMVAGANLFEGRNLFTFFGQFERATNAYLRIRRNY